LWARTDGFVARDMPSSHVWAKYLWRMGSLTSTAKRLDSTLLNLHPSPFLPPVHRVSSSSKLSPARSFAKQSVGSQTRRVFARAFFAPPPPPPPPPFFARLAFGSR